MFKFKSNNRTEMENFRQNMILLPKPPKDERPPHAARLIKSRRVAAKMQEEVKWHLKEFEASQSILCQSREMLKKRQAEAQHSTCNLLKYSVEQQSFAEEKAHCYTELLKTNMTFLQELKEELETLKIKHKHVKQQVEVTCLYAKYFDEVLKKNKQFDEAHELMAHFHNRKLIQQELSASIDKMMEELLNSQTKLEYTRKHYSYTKSINETKINMLKKKLEKAEQQVFKWEDMWSNVNRTASMKMFEQTQINQVAFSLSKNLWHIGSEISKPHKLVETIKLLEKIQEFICDLKVILGKVGKTEDESSDNQLETQE